MPQDIEPREFTLPMTSDHDLLIELRVDMKALRKDVGEINDNTKGTLDDHETRLRFLERWVWMALGAIAVVEVIIGWYLTAHYG